jgi:hypothetical protein
LFRFTYNAIAVIINLEINYVVFMALTIPISPYHPPLPRKGSTPLSFFDLSRVFNKYLKLASFPLGAATSLLGGLKQLPLSPSHLAQIVAREIVLKFFKATFSAPQFFISQINLYQAWAEISEKNTSQNSKVSNLFFANLSSILSVIKMAQLLEKLGKVDWMKVSPSLPEKLAKTSNLMILTFVTRGLVSNPSAGRALGFLQVSSGSLKLFFNFQVASLVLSLASLTSLTLGLLNNLSEYRSMLGSKETSSRLSSVYALPA